MIEDTYAQGIGYQSEQLAIRRARTRNKAGILSRMRQLFKYLGPAFIVSVAYIDPGKSVLYTSK